MHIRGFFILNRLQNSRRIKRFLRHDYITAANDKKRPYMAIAADVKKRQYHEMSVAGLDSHFQGLDACVIQLAKMGIESASRDTGGAAGI